MTARRTIFCCLLVALVSGSATAQSGLLLASPDDEPIPTFYLQRRVRDLEGQIRALEERRPGVTSPRRLAALEASIHVRRTALALLSAAVNQPTASTSPAALLGCTLANRVQDLDRLFERPTDPRLAHAVSRWFNAIAPLSLNQPGSAQWDRVQRALQNRLSCLLVLTDSGGVAARELWSADAAGPAPVDFEALSRQAPELAELALNLAQAQRFGEEFAPQLADAGRVLTSVAAVLSQLETAAWLTAEDRAAIHRVFTGFLADYAQPDRREAALEVWDHLHHAAPIFAGINRLSLDRTAATGLGRLLAVGVGRVGEESTRSTGGDALRWLERFVRVSERFATLPTAQGSVDLLRADAQERARFRTGQQRLIESLPRAAGDPTLVRQPPLTAPLAAMEIQSGRLRTLLDAVGQLPVLHRTDPRLGLAVGRRIATRITELTGERRDSALRELEAFVAQSPWLTTLPGEAALRADAGAWSEAGIDDAATLLRLIDRERQSWLTAWAEGQAPASAGRNLAALRHWMGLMEQALSARAERRGGATLNDWPGWEVEPSFMDSLLDRLLDRLREGSAHAQAGRFTDLAALMEQLGRDQPVTLLLVRLHQGTAAARSRRPAGPRGALLELLLAPDPRRFPAPIRQDLALLCRYLNEFTQRRVLDDEPMRNHVRDACAALAQRLTTWLDSRESDTLD